VGNAQGIRVKNNPDPERVEFHSIAIPVAALPPTPAVSLRLTGDNLLLLIRARLSLALEKPGGAPGKASLTALVGGKPPNVHCYFPAR